MSCRYSKLANLSVILALFSLTIVGILGLYNVNRLTQSAPEISHFQYTTVTIRLFQAVIVISIVLIVLAIFLLRQEIKQKQEARERVFKLDHELKSRTAQLESANKELESFSYSISHDLRAPIRHICGFVELLEKQPIISQDAKSSRQLGFIGNAARNMGGLVDGLASFSSLLSTEMRLVRVQPASLVKEIKEDLADSYSGRCVLWKIDEKIPEVHADSSMIRLVLLSLLSNSLKFTRPRSEAVIEIEYSSTPAEHVFAIKDNGVGFEMEYADKLFGVFQRLHHSDEFEGTGMGLATVRRIISRHGGRTWAEGKVGQGANFFFTLPISPVHPSFNKE